jgi:hypothetical protein
MTDATGLLDMFRSSVCVRNAIKYRTRIEGLTVLKTLPPLWACIVTPKRQE